MPLIFCVQGVGAVQLGMGPSDRFFCSQFVLEAYRRAGLPVTDADPRLLSPADCQRRSSRLISSRRAW
jgi:hypothetical protein